MLINYDNLTPESKIYLYPSSRKFYTNELDALNLKINDFLLQWTDYNCSYKIMYQRFLIFFLDEKAVISTVLLDKLTTFIFSLEKDYNLLLLDKVNVCFKQGEHVQYQEMKKFRTLVKNKSISKKTIVFNNLIQTKYEFENDWEVPFEDSWLSHLIK